jgi:hypothetical protein
MLIDYEEYLKLTAQMENRKEYILQSATAIADSADHMAQCAKGLVPYLVFTNGMVSLRLLDSTALLSTTEPCIALLPILKTISH